MKSFFCLIHLLFLFVGEFFPDPYIVRLQRKPNGKGNKVLPRRLSSLVKMLLCMFLGLVECYLGSDRYRDAMAVAKNAHKTLGATSRTLIVCY